MNEEDKIRKKYDDLTLGEIKAMIPCRDEKGNYNCSKCKFKISFNGRGYCWRNGFFSNLWMTLEKDPNFVLDDSSDEWMVEIPANLLKDKQR